MGNRTVDMFGKNPEEHFIELILVIKPGCL